MSRIDIGSTTNLFMMNFIIKLNINRDFIFFPTGCHFTQRLSSSVLQAVVASRSTRWQHIRRKEPLGTTAGPMSCDSVVLFIGMVIKAIKPIITAFQMKAFVSH